MVDPNGPVGPDETGPELDEMLCFALYTASRAMTARYRPRLDALGLTYPQYLVLVVLADDGQMSVRGLGERLRLDSGTLSPLLRRLEAAQLITRSPHHSDERSLLVQVTAAGIAARAEAGRIPVEIAGALCADGDGLGVDIDLLRGELRRLEIALRDTGTSPAV